jgi:hypothetical protein
MRFLCPYSFVVLIFVTVLGGAQNMKLCNMSLPPFFGQHFHFIAWVTLIESAWRVRNRASVNDKGKIFNLLKPSGNFTYHQV